MIFEGPTSTGKMEAAVQLTDSKTAHLFGPVFCGRKLSLKIWKRWSMLGVRE